MDFDLLEQLNKNDIEKYYDDAVTDFNAISVLTTWIIRCSHNSNSDIFYYVHPYCYDMDRHIGVERLIPANYAACRNECNSIACYEKLISCR